MKIRKRQFLQQSAVLAASVTFGKAIAQPAEIIVGAPNSLTGGFGEASERVVAGLRIAIDMINREGGIKSMGGAKLRMIAADTSSDNPTQAASVTRRLITQDKAVVLVGCNASAMTLSAQVEAERAEVPLLTTSYADPLVERGYKYTFKLPIQGSQVFDLSLGYATELMKEAGKSAKKIAVFYGSDSSSQAAGKAADGLAKKYGLEVVSSVPFASNLTDPTPIVAAARRSRPDLILLSSFTSDVILVTRALRAVGIDVPILSAGGGLATDSTGEALGKAANGLMGVVHWNWDLPGPDAKRIAEDYRKLYPDRRHPPASETLGTGYALGIVIRAALEKAASADPKKIRDVIASLEVPVPLPGGKISFDERGMNRNAQPIMVSWIDGELRTIWPKQYQTRKPVL